MAGCDRENLWCGGESETVASASASVAPSGGEAVGSGDGDGVEERVEGRMLGEERKSMSCGS
jgi:hypothetical protein